MKIFLIALILSLPLFSQSQDLRETLFKEKCFYQTNGVGKSLGIKIKLYTPCIWETKEGIIPKAAKTFTYHFPDNSMLVSTLIIEKLPKAIEAVKAITDYSDAELKRYAIRAGKVLSMRRTMIGGVKCIEFKNEIKMEVPSTKIYQYQLIYVFFYNQISVTVIYATVSDDQLTSKMMYNTYEMLFKSLADRVLLLNPLL